MRNRLSQPTASYDALMRKLVVTENVTVDGVIDSAGGWFAPGDDTADLAAVTAVLQEQSAASDALLLGRTSFEEMRAFWPQQTNDTTGIAAHLDRVQKFVVSSTMTEPRWENTTILRGSIVDEVTALKEQQGKDIVTTGSITLVHELIVLGLVDEYRLFTYPVVLGGHGRRLFQDAHTVPELVLQDVQRFGSTIVLTTYGIAR
jgi:dihydrofolate reductase